MVGIHEAERRHADLHRIAERSIEERTDLRVVRPDMCLRIDHDRMALTDPVLDGREEILIRAHPVRKRKSAERRCPLAEHRNIKVIRMHDDKRTRRPRKACLKCRIAERLRVVSVEEIAFFLIGFQLLFADDLLPEDHSSVEYDDRVHHDAVEKKTGKFLGKGLPLIIIRAIDLRRCRLEGRKLVVELI